MVKETLNTCLSQLAKITLKLSTLVGDIFTIYWSQMPFTSMTGPIVNIICKNKMLKMGSVHTL